MTTIVKTRLIRALVGMLSGAAITGVLVALLCFLFVITHDEDGLISWAVLAGMAGSAYGLAEGLILGLFLGFIQRGPSFGAVSGAVYGVAINAALMVFFTPPKWETREIIFCAAFILITMLSGLSVSLVLSAITSMTRRRNDDHEWLSLEEVLSRLAQDKAT